MPHPLHGAATTGVQKYPKPKIELKNQKYRIEKPVN